MRVAVSIAILAWVGVFGMGRDARSETPVAGPATALILSIDTSGSVDLNRYQLQLEGVAEALEDPVTLSAISAAGGSGIYLAIVTWADAAEIAIDWRRVASAADARAAAQAVRRLPRTPGEFTCIGGMFRTVNARLMRSIPTPVERVVIDVSGDGIDNCGGVAEIHEERDALIGLGATINGLPIRVPGENDVVGVGAFRKPGFGLRELPGMSDQEASTIDRWYKDHVIGGSGAFMLVAQGYEDFARALRRKLVTEISDLGTAAADRAN